MSAEVVADFLVSSCRRFENRIYQNQAAIIYLFDFQEIVAKYCVRLSRYGTPADRVIVELICRYYATRRAQADVFAK